jgi:hypothetical protein
VLLEPPPPPVAAATAALCAAMASACARRTISSWLGGAAAAAAAAVEEEEDDDAPPFGSWRDFCFLDAALPFRRFCKARYVWSGSHGAFDGKGKRAGRVSRQVRTKNRCTKHTGLHQKAKRRRE